MSDLFTPRMRKRIWRALPTSQALLLHHSRKRVLGKLRRIPPWADLAAIADIYAEARLIAVATGVDQHVDHHFPLQGKTVCGFHVAANLVIVPAAANLRKHNKMPDDPECWQPLPPAPEPAKKARRNARIDYHAMFPNSVMRRRRAAAATDPVRRNAIG